MNGRRVTLFRWGRAHHEHMMVLAMLVVVCIASIRLLNPEPPAESRQLWERVLISLFGLMQCFGLVIGVSLFLAFFEVVKQTAARYQARRVENKLARLEPIV